jgi:hypothetical protein
MKHLFSIIIISALLIALPACGNGNGKEDSKEPAVSKTESKAASEISVIFSDKEEYKPGAFELKKAMGFISGMRYNAEATAKLAYVVFANYDAQIGIYGLDMPKEAGQIVIEVAFKTENKVTSMQEQMEEYAKMKVPTGDFQPAWMGDSKCFQVTYYVGGESGGMGMSGTGASGTATLTTSTPEKLIGSIDFTSVNGSTIKGTFNVKVEKDMWKN